MASTNQDIVRVYDTKANLPSVLIAGQFGYSTDTDEIAVKRLADSAMKYYANTGAGTYILADGTQALTGNWDVGDFDITNIDDLDADKLAISETITLASTVWAGLGAAKGRIVFTDAATDTITLMTCDVGIGVSDPDTKVEILNAGNQLKLSYGAADNCVFAVDTTGNLTITPSGNIVSIGNYLKLDKTGIVYWGASASQGRLTWDTGKVMIGGRASNDLELQANNSTKMYVMTSGNVGIGVSDPDTKLEILKAGNQLKLSYDGTDNCTFAVDTSGDLTVTPSGTQATISGLVRSTGSVIIGNDTATDTKMTVGLNIQQGAADDIIFACQSGDVGQAFTDFADAATFFSIQKQSGGGGGVALRSFGENGSSNFNIEAHTPTGGDPALILSAWKSDGTGRQAQDNDDKIYELRNGTTVLQRVWGMGNTEFYSADGGGLATIILDQSDVDEPFIKFVGDAADGVLTRDLVSINDACGTVVGYFKVQILDDGNQITDGDYYVAFQTLAVP